MGQPPAEESREEARVIGGRYRLLHQLGQGAMGPTWRADDDLLECAVAIKQVVLPRRSRDRAELHERILRESRAAARLVHRHTVTVLDVIEDGGQPWIVTELLAAESLAGLVGRAGPLPSPRVAEIGLALLGALDAAHALGIVHRDVRPGNVLLGTTRIVLGDFGTATLDGDPAYTAPEREQGHPPGPAGDLWSLGATLHFAVQGRPPGDGTPAARADGPLEALLDGLLQCDPERRLDAAGARRLLSDSPEQPAVEEPVTQERIVEEPVQQPAQAAPPPPQVPPAAPVASSRRRLRARVLGAGRPAAAPAATAPATAGPPTAPPAGGPALTQFTSEAGWRVAIPAGWRSDGLGAGNYTFLDPSGAVAITIRSAPATDDDPLAELKARYESAQDQGSQAHYLGTVPYRGFPAADYDHTDLRAGGPPQRGRARNFIVGVRRYEISVTAPADRWGEGGPCFAGATDTFVPV